MCWVLLWQLGCSSSSFGAESNLCTSGLWQEFIEFFNQWAPSYVCNDELSVMWNPHEIYELFCRGEIHLSNLCINLVGCLEHVFFFHILGIVTPTDFHILQRGRAQPPTSVAEQIWTVHFSPWVAWLPDSLWWCRPETNPRKRGRPFRAWWIEIQEASDWLYSHGPNFTSYNKSKL